MARQPPLSWLRPSVQSQDLSWTPGDRRLADFGRRLRELRLAHGLTIGELGLPYSRAYVSLLEAGGIAPTVRALETIAERLAVSPAELLRVRESH